MFADFGESSGPGASPLTGRTGRAGALAYGSSPAALRHPKEDSMTENLHEAGLRSEHAYLAGLASVGLSFVAWATRCAATRSS